MDEVVTTGLETSSAGAAVTALLGTAGTDEVAIAGAAVAGAVLVRTAVPGIVPLSGTAEDTAPDDAVTGIAASTVAVLSLIHI